MERELYWQRDLNAQPGAPPDRAYGSADGKISADLSERQARLHQALSLEQADENRRFSIVAAALMFVIGFGCGTIWTVFLTWMF